MTDVQWDLHCLRFSCWVASLRGNEDCCKHGLSLWQQCAWPVVSCATVILPI